ncbi:MAG TPA: pentapeptide repeat-containing protein, partial [Caulobacter sp.]|nr:pentapeptide repeat-containing protein [Caulobacter sp.]
MPAPAPAATLSGRSPQPSLVRALSPPALKAAIGAHLRYLKGLPGGARANLSYVDLDNINLEGVDLSEADLTGVRLAGALLA